MEVASGAVVFFTRSESLQSWLCTGSDVRSWWHSQELKSAGGLPVPWRQQWQTLELRGFSPSLTRAATRGETFNFYHRPDQYYQYPVNTERFISQFRSVFGYHSKLQVLQFTMLFCALQLQKTIIIHIVFLVLQKSSYYTGF